MSTLPAEVPQIETCHHDATSPSPPEGKENDASMSVGDYRTANHPCEAKGINIQSECGAQSQDEKLFNGSQNNKVLSPTPLDAKNNRRPRSSNAFDVPIVRTPTSATTRTSETAGTTGSHSNNSETQRDLWKVKLAGGGFLDSTSYESLHDDNVRTNATNMLRRLKLNNLNGDDDDEPESSTATTKVSNFTFQKEIQKTSLHRSLSATGYYRPSDSFAEKDGGSSSISRILPSSKTAKSSGSRSRSKAIEVTGAVSNPLDLLSVTISPNGLPARMSSLSYAYTSSEDAETPCNQNITNLRQVPLVKSTSESNDNSVKRMQNVYSYESGEVETPYNQNISSMRHIALVKSASESDDDSVKRMENVTHTFQRKQNEAGGANSNKMKSSAAPLSGIGVDVTNDYNKDDPCRVLTPREAANASCSISSVIGEIFGLTPPKEEGRSPFSIVKNMLCSPDRMRSASSANKGARKKPTNTDVADDWSVGVDVRTEVSQYTYGDDERSYSYARPSRHSSGIGGTDAYLSRHVPNQKSRKSCGGETRQEKYDKSLSFRQYHREDLSYYGTEAGGNCYQPSQHSCADEEGDTISPMSTFPRQAPNRKSRKSRGGETRQEKYDKSLSFRQYHREDLSYYGTEAGSTCYQPSQHSCADEEGDTISPMSTFQHQARYRDSPFVRRFNNRRCDDRYGDDESSYS